MFGNSLREVRKNRGYTLEELSDLYNSTYDAGMNKGTLSKYENNKQEPMISVVANLASLLKVPVDFLLEVPRMSSEKELETFNITELEEKILLEYRKADNVEKEMVHRILHMNYNTTNMKSQASKPFLLNAARPRTDLKPEEITEEMRQYDEDIMDDPNF